MNEPMNIPPPGALQEEVADDVDVKVSNGEFIVPANVVRFYGTNYFLKLMKKAEEEIQSDEKLGGDPESLPFSPDELGTEEEAPAFAVGGLVSPGSVSQYEDKQGRKIYAPSDDLEGKETPLPILPKQKATAFLQNQGESSNERGKSSSKENPMTGAVTNWGVEDFSRYEKQLNDPASKVIGGIISQMPLGGLFQQVRTKYLNKAVPETISTMLETGVDNMGNPLTDAQRTSLQQTLTTVSTKQSSSGFGGGIADALGGLFSKKEEKVSKKEDKSSTAKDNESDDGPSSGPTGPSTYYSETGSTTAPTEEEESSPGMYKGGLITRKTKKKR